MEQLEEEQLTPAPPGAAAAGTLSRLGKICPGIIGRLGKNCASVRRPGKTVPTLSRLGNLSTGTSMTSLCANFCLSEKRDRYEDYKL